MRKLIVRKMFAYAILFTFFASSIFLASCKNAADSGGGGGGGGTPAAAGNTGPTSSQSGQQKLTFTFTSEGATFKTVEKEVTPGDSVKFSDIVASVTTPTNNRFEGWVVGSNIIPVNNNDMFSVDTTFTAKIRPEDMKPEGVTGNEYDDIEKNHKKDVDFAKDLDGSEWSCNVGNFYQYLIFEDLYGFVAVFYGSGDTKEAAKRKAYESKTSFETNFDMKNDNDCSIGTVTVENGETIRVQLMPLPDLSMPTGYIYVNGGFYMSPSGQLIARPANNTGDKTDFKIGFVKEN